MSAMTRAAPDHRPTDPQLEAALRAAGLRGVDTSTRRLAEYSSDASLYRVPPSAVVFAESVDDIEAVLAVCRQQDVPLTMRGAGTSVAGNAVGTGVVLDTTRLNRILDFDPDTRLARVQPGVVLDQLQQVASAHGLRFGPDPSTHSRCTIGGMIGNNACGARALAYGRTSDNVHSLDVVTGSGDRLHVGGGIPSSPASHPAVALAQGNLALIRTEFGRLRRQISGYSLEHLLPEKGMNLARFLVGTEGTCALTLEATVSLVESPAATCLLVLGYADMAAAADAVPALLPFHVTALEGLDARIVNIVRERHGSRHVPALPTGSGWLFLECPGNTLVDAVDVAHRMLAQAESIDSRIITDPAEITALWRIREEGAGLAARATSQTRSHAGWEDAAVPPERLGAYIREFDALLVHHGLLGFPYGHFGDGCLHVRLDFPLDHKQGKQLLRAFLTDAADLVAAHGGSMSGEHGDGRARSELLPRMYSPAALALMADVKKTFDPQGVLNPGVIVDPLPFDADLRLLSAPALTKGLAHSFVDDAGDFSRAVHRCTGVGKCVAPVTEGNDVMCPSFLATRDEKDSTRGRSRVLQEMVNGSLVRKGWASPEVHEALDLCLSCKACLSDCPTGVDMATYKSEVLHQRYRGRLRPRAHYSLGWLPRMADVAARAPSVVNGLLASPVAGLLKRIAGIDHRRDLPRFTSATFRSSIAQSPSALGATSVALWIDTFTDHFSPDVAHAALAVLEGAGCDVTIVTDESCCGITWISTGQLVKARNVLQRTVAVLEPLARQGVPIVALEPSCAAALRDDAVKLLPGNQSAALVSQSVKTLAEFLSALPDWTPPSLTGTKIVAQPHCHHHAVMGWSADEELLTRAGAELTRVGGCCGLAGNFGAEIGHYEVSLAVAATHLTPALEQAAHDAVILADGFSCRTQIAHVSSRSGVHLAQLLESRLNHGVADMGPLG
jgi:FAD/FMN-containing dehydrogenase/Fe-S oxidoreductase